MEERPRVSIAAEVRAWISVGTLLAVNMIGGVWWAATLNAEIRQLRDSVAEIKGTYADRYSGADAARDLAITRNRLEDHEVRIRELERRAR
jgi:hypothetical protein